MYTEGKYLRKESETEDFNEEDNSGKKILKTFIY